MSGAHTPGPWVLNNHLFVKAPNGFVVAQVRMPNTQGKDDDEGAAFCRANASLIAAAPDMLAAIERFMPKGIAIGNGNVPDGLCIPMNVTMGELRAFAAAIAKARGAS